MISIKQQPLQIIVVSAVILLVCSLRFLHAPNYPYYEDEAISIKTAQGIIKTGIPISYDGKLYPRNALHHYLLSTPLYFFGLNPYSARSISIVFSILVLIIVYKIGKDIHSEYVGIIAVLLLGFLRYENQYAISARFYASFQFFFILTLYLFYKGFVEGVPRFKIWAIVSFICTIFTHELAVELVPVLLLFLLITKGIQWLRYKIAIVGMLLVGMAIYFVHFHDFSNQLEATSVNQLFLAGLSNRFAFAGKMNSIITSGFSLILIGLIYLIKKKEPKLFFYYFSFLTGLIVLSIIAPSGSKEYMFNLFPLYILLVVYTFVKVCSSVIRWVPRILTESMGKEFFERKRTVIYVLLFLSLIPVLVNAFEKKLGFKSSQSMERGPAHLLIEEKMVPGEILISTNTWVTDIYLRAPDYFLRQKKLQNGKWGEFGFERDGYGFTMLDSIEKLEKLMNVSPGIWIYADHKIREFASDELIYFVRRNFDLVYQEKDSEIAVYYWYPDRCNKSKLAEDLTNG